MPGGKQRSLRLLKLLPCWILVACALAACGGGGGGSSGGGYVPSTPVSSVTTPPTSTFTLTGAVNTTGAACDGVTANCASTGSASGFNVVLGSIPTAGNGGSPIAPLYTATTDSSGHFSLTSVPTGTYEIQIGKDATFATLHAKVIVTSAASLTYAVSALGVGEQSWFTSINAYRSQNGVVAIGADEYAMEAARAYAEYLLANSGPGGTVCNPTCVNYPQFAQQYQTSGGLFAYSDTYRAALIESDCSAFAEQDSNQGPMLKTATARFGGYGFRGSGVLAAGDCAFSIVSN